VSPTFRSLRNRNYRLFAGGQVISLTGSWMQMVAQGWLALRLTHDSGAALGVVAALQTLPMLLFGLWGGLVADRYSKRKVLIGAMALEGILALTLGVLDTTGVVAYWHVLLLAFLMGLVQVVETPARQAFVIEMVGPEDVPNAVGLNSATFNIARVFGPVAAGLLVNAVGTGPVFLANGASFAAVIAGLLAMRAAELRPAPVVGRGPGQLREGLRYVKSRPDLLLPIVLIGVVGTFGFNFAVTLPLIAKHTFHRDAAAYGVMSAAIAVGALMGSLASARRTRPPRQRMLVATTVLFGALEVVAGLMPSYLTLLLVLVPTGAVVLTLATSCNSTVQLGSSPEMRGRVMALYILVFMGGTPIGAPLIGLAVEHFGPRSGLIIGGAICAVAGIVVLAATLHNRQLRMVTHLRPRPHVHVVPGA
jgi:MFS family permease